MYFYYIQHIYYECLIRIVYESIYGRVFEDEISQLKHSRAGMLSMANQGSNTNGSQFFITYAECPWYTVVVFRSYIKRLDGKHTVFGLVTEGMSVLKQIETYGSKSGKTKGCITIVDCGQI